MLVGIGTGGIELDCVVLDTDDVDLLASFYQRLLGWRRVGDSNSSWIRLEGPGGGAGLAIQHEPRFRPPRWPAADGHQQMQSHLDLRAEDLDAAVRHARACGATLAEEQFVEAVRVCLGPSGHPFCLFRG